MTSSKPLPPLDADALWALERLGTPTLSPDGRHAVCTLTRYSMEHNRASASLWLMPTDRCAPRQLTRCGERDGQPAWSPRGDRIAFVSRRKSVEGEAGKNGSDGQDPTPQLYLIAPDGGEALRASDFAPGIESFKWMPDGRRIVFSAWVWPELRGAAAQARRHKTFGERKASGYATSAALYRHFDHNIPQDRVLHLLLLDLDSGRITDLFEGTALELPRQAEGNVVYDPSPDGRRIAFAHDPAAEPMGGNPLALAEIEVRNRRIRTLAQDPGWDFGAPRWRPDGLALAATAAPVGRRHTAFNRLALVEPGARGRATRWQVLGEDWDHHVDAPLRWSADGRALFFTAEERGRCHLWRHDLSPGDFTIVQRGGWVQGFELAGSRIVSAADSARHPARLLAVPEQGGEPLRLERCNDRLLARHRLGEVREIEVRGALGEPVQMWLTLPVDFKPRRKHPVMHVIHGGPFAAAGDTFSYRWNPHALAARGQVVAQVNYHGSSGFGEDFRHSIMGRQGELELQDIEAASDWLLAQPWADARRLSATGGSYGGFLVAWMNGHVPAWPQGRYRAYVCHAGVFDRIATFSADSYAQRPRDLQARYWEDMDKVVAQSPHCGAARMDTPTLVIHGALDYRVPDCNGLAYYNTLKARGVPARLLWFPDENHWVLKPRNSRLWYREFLDWIDAPGDAAKAGGRAR